MASDLQLTPPDDPLADPWIDRWMALADGFSPSAPINRRDLFAGRLDQLGDMLSVIGQVGQHAVLYGERGVGKTSLTTVFGEFLTGQMNNKPRTILAPRTNCDGTDDFSSIWRKVLSEIQFAEETRGVGFRPQLTTALRTAEEFLGNASVTPDAVRRALEVIGQSASVIVFIDEFDRVQGAETKALFADTIKTLSDHLSSVTVVLVGVADTVGSLILEHQSVERALVQIHVPRMSEPELEKIVNQGLSAAGLNATPGALLRIAWLSKGLPHYTHLLGLYAGQAAVDRKSLTVEGVDVTTAINSGIRKAQETIARAFDKATLSSRNALYEQVLTACALVASDRAGFTPADIRQPLRQVTGRRYEIPAYIKHLNALSQADRGPVLEKRGQPHGYRYRFADPLLQPYVIMRGIASQLIPSEIFEPTAANPEEDPS